MLSVRFSSCLIHRVDFLDIENCFVHSIFFYGLICIDYMYRFSGKEVSKLLYRSQYEWAKYEDLKF